MISFSKICFFLAGLFFLSSSSAEERETEERETGSRGSTAASGREAGSIHVDSTTKEKPNQSRYRARDENRKRLHQVVCGEAGSLQIEGCSLL